MRKRNMIFVGNSSEFSVMNFGVKNLIWMKKCGNIVLVCIEGS